MTAADIAAQLVSLESTAVLAVVPPLTLWLYRSRKQLAELDRLSEWVVIVSPALVIAIAAYAAEPTLSWLVLLATLIAKVLVGLGFNSKPVLPAGEERS